MNQRDNLTIGVLSITAVVLLVGAGLLMRSFLLLQEVDPGFDPAGVITMRLELPRQSYRTYDEWLNGYTQLSGRIAGIPGVTDVAFTTEPPLGGMSSYWSYQIDGRPLTGPGLEYSGMPAHLIPVSASYFRTLGIPLVAGRGFSERDRRGDELVAVINETVARRDWPDDDPVGARISFEEEPEEGDPFRKPLGSRIVIPLHHAEQDEHASADASCRFTRDAHLGARHALDDGLHSSSVSVFPARALRSSITLARRLSSSPDNSAWSPAISRTSLH